ncbi:MAG: GNAT family N-acetyltransferase [Methanobacteriota archaeon]|nr:MAG: GNAT family N-acetyltransferase [Euryarchaeota archaeon]
MRVRTYDEIDPLAAFRLGVVSFGSAWDEAKVRRVRAHDRTYLEEFALYAEERGRVLAQVVPRRLAVRTTNGVEEVGGLAAVCSHPGVWGRGFARRLIEATHDRFRELGLSVSALTTSRNIRGYGVYAKLGYVDLAPFQQAIRQVTRRMAPKGYGLRAVRRSDMSTIHRLYRTQTRRMLGWTERPERALEWGVIRTRDYLEKYRIVLRDGQAVGYLRTRPHDGITMEEVVAPNPQDFRAAVALMEAKAETGIATVNWITARSDVTRFRSLGYTVDGPFPDTTMAVSLVKEIRTTDLARRFGGTTGKFVQYPTDDF